MLCQAHFTLGVSCKIPLSKVSILKYYYSFEIVILLYNDIQSFVNSVHVPFPNPLSHCNSVSLNQIAFKSFNKKCLSECKCDIEKENAFISLDLVVYVCVRMNESRL